MLLKGTRAVSFIKTGVHNHSFEEPLSIMGWENSLSWSGWDMTAMKIPEENWNDLKIGNCLKIPSTSQVRKAILLLPVWSGNQHHQKALSFQQNLAGTEHIPSTCLDVDGTERNTSTKVQTHDFPGLSQEVEGHHPSLHLGSICLFAPRAPKNCHNEKRAEVQIWCSGAVLAGRML